MVMIDQGILPVNTPRQALYKLWPKQVEALRLFGLGPNPDPEPVEELMYGGEAGGGKSHLARALGVTAATLWPGCKIALFRRTYRELYDTHIRRIQQELPLSAGKYVVSAKEFQFKNGSVMMFRYCEHEDDVLSYKSEEFDVLIVDEATTLTKFMISFLRSRVRGTRKNWRPIILYCTNPGDVGHVYFKTGFHDPIPAGGRKFLAPEDDGGLRRYFLRARLGDNPALDPKEYTKVLSGISDPELRRAVQEGDWTIFKGQYFGIWRYDHHVVRPFEIPRHWWNRRLSIDYGFAADWAAHAYVRDEDLWSQERINRWYAYHEWYAKEVDEDIQAELLVQFLKSELKVRHFYEEPIHFIAVADPSMWNKTKGKPSAAKTYGSHGLFLTKANNDRVQGWRQLYSLLEYQRRLPDGTTELVWPDGLPSLLFFENCERMIKAIPDLQRDKDKPEDTKQGPIVDDHGPDNARYFAMNIAPLSINRRADTATRYQLGMDNDQRLQRKRHPGTYTLGVSRAARR